MGTSPNQIDHIGIAVRDLDEAVSRYEKLLSATAVHREVVQSDQVEEVLFRVGESFVQLICPLGSDSPVARFLDQHGEGIHHVAYRVNDCAEALAEASENGFDLVDESPRPGSRRTLVGFVHPKSVMGTLVEFVEEGREA